MQPLIVADQVVQGVSDFLRAAFPSSTQGFDQLIETFLNTPDKLFHGPYLSIPLPFRPLLAIVRADERVAQLPLVSGPSIQRTRTLA